MRDIVEAIYQYAVSCGMYVCRLRVKRRRLPRSEVARPARPAKCVLVRTQHDFFLFPQGRSGWGAGGVGQVFADFIGGAAKKEFYTKLPRTGTQKRILRSKNTGARLKGERAQTTAAYRVLHCHTVFLAGPVRGKQIRILQRNSLRPRREVELTTRRAPSAAYPQ